MLKITVATHKISNETIPKDTVLDYQTIFQPWREYVDGAPKSGVNIVYKISTWLKAGEYSDPNTPPIAGDFKEYGSLKYKLSDSELADLKANTGDFYNVFQGVQNILKAKIESGWNAYTGVGEGNVIDYTSAI